MVMDSGALAFSSGAVLIGISLLALGMWRRLQELAPRCWKRVSGNIVASTIAKEYAGHGGYQFVPVIKYEYCYDGRIFKSSSWSPGNYISGRKPAAEAVVSRYPEGSHVEVLVNPRHAAKSVLEFGSTFLSRMFITAGLVFFALALLPLVIK
jgi:hypothetical protein